MDPWHLGFFVTVVAMFFWSAIKPASYLMWMMEIAPLLAGLVLLVVTYRRLTLTTLCYGLLAVSFIWGAIGGHYGFTHVPFFDWLREHYHLQRNHFDRVGHFIQGATVTMVARELLLRLTPMKAGWLLTGYVLSIGMALSMSYEIFEWAVAALRLPMSVEFVGMQGDFWDAQWDMFLGLVGSVLALVSLSPFQDESLRHRSRL
ncbi:DUF2238 domain-containing protein [Heliobacterium chlorum]|uniref:DUF2238 domain-containing protein n=1 Tax=Heliobacterium chlorum TaxID=2698 RepID=A0ABR7T2J9_HELCL|nr:DUF2238 domain-containing protein [Heliobacterium chlorum]MBC9784999.1 DUF2238 domain-containing protein [Heliobacterium chlorum]